MRCLALAQELQKLGSTITFSTNYDALAVCPSLKNFKVRFESTNDFLHCIDEKKIFGRILIVDDYSWEADFDHLCRKGFSTIVSIDDYAHREYACDVILNQNLGWRPNDYNKKCNGEIRYLIGPDYALLRPEFSQIRERGLRKRINTKRILVCLGLGEYLDLEENIINLLRAFEKKIDVDLISVNYTPMKNKNMSRHIKYHKFTEKIADLMAGADLAIGGAGSSSWERCCLGLPALNIVLAKNQFEIARHIEIAGASRTFYASDSQLMKKLSEALDELISSPEKLQKMSLKAPNICDGRGAIRAALAILDYE